MSDLANHRIEVLEKAQSANVAYQREVMGILRGSNGDLGLLHTVDAIDTRLEGVEDKLDGLKVSSTALKDSIDALRQERRDDQKTREGSIGTLKWIRFALGVILSLVLIGGSLGLYQTRTQFEQVQRQLQNIPSIPE